MRFAPDMFPVAMIRPVVPRLPTFALPVTLNVPVSTPDVAPMLPTLALPVTLNLPAVTRFPPVILPVARTRPGVLKFAALALPVARSTPPVTKLPPVCCLSPEQDRRYSDFRR